LTLTLTPTDATCNGASDGSVSAAFGGGGTLEIKIDGNAFAAVSSSSPQVFSGLAAGTHTVILRRSNATTCSITSTTSVGEPNTLTLTLTPTDANCNGESTGSVSAAFGGGGSLEISIDGNSFGSVSSASPQVFSGLAAGTHTVVLRRTNATSCSITSTTTVGEPTALDLSTVVKDCHCFGESTGKVDLTVSGGTPSYSFLWSNGDTTEDIDHLPAGNSYKVVVTDAHGCMDSTISAPINEPPAVEPDADNNGPVCANQMLTLSGNPTGLKSYVWTGPNGFTSYSMDTTVSNHATEAMEGLYTLTVTNDSGCVGVVTTFVTVDTLPIVSFDSIGNLCSNDTNYLLDGGLPAGGVYSGVGVSYHDGNYYFSPGVAGMGIWEIKYTVTNNNGCEDSAFRDITVVDCYNGYCGFTQGFWGSATGSSCYPLNGTIQSIKGSRILAYLLTDSLVMGEIATSCTGSGKTRSWTIQHQDSTKLIAVLPAGGTSKAFSAVSASGCTNPWAKYNSVFTSGGSISPSISAMKNGKIANTLIGQAVTMALNLRYDTSLASLEIKGSYINSRKSKGCDDSLKHVPTGDTSTWTIPSSIINYLGTGYTVQDLLDLANKALSGSYTPSGSNPTLSDINYALDAFNRGFDECRVLISFADTSNSGNAPMHLDDGVAESRQIQGFEMMPNPATSTVTFDLSNFIGTHGNLEMLDQIGRVIWTNNFSTIEQPVYTLNLAQGRFSEGIYIVKFTTENGRTITKKLFITKE